jgi:hypothetical protein
LSQKRFELFWLSDPPVPKNGIDPAVKFERVVEAKVGVVEISKVLLLHERFVPAVIREDGVV